MSLTRRVLIILLVVITALVAVVAYRTATYTPLAGDLTSPVELAPAVRIDGALLRSTWRKPFDSAPSVTRTRRTTTGPNGTVCTRGLPRPTLRHTRP